MSLRSPGNKMSKSDTSEHARIDLNDSPEEIRQKIAKAMTDNNLGITYDPKKRPGISNLVELLGHMTDRVDFQKIAEENAGLQAKDFKEKVAESIITGLEGIRKEYTKIKESGIDHLDEVSRDGAQMANVLAGETLALVMKATGMN